MTRHELKTINPHFNDIWDGQKTFEIRKDDRPGGYHAGDILILREYIPPLLFDDGVGKYTGRRMTCAVNYVLAEGKFEGLATKYCAMSINVLERTEMVC